MKHVLGDKASDNLEGGSVVLGIQSELKSRLGNFSGCREEGEITDQICPECDRGNTEARCCCQSASGRRQ